jgi:hypothetical protein
MAWRAAFCATALTSMLAACGGSNAPSDSTAPHDSSAPVRSVLQPPALATPYEAMGNSVAIQGDVAVVGAWDAAKLKQRAFVFRRAADTWKFEQRLELDEQEMSGFVSGRGTIRIDRPLIAFETFSAAFVYRYDGGAWKPDLVVKGEQFGRGQFEAVAVNSDRFAFTFNVSAENPHDYSSRVYVYRRAGGKWEKEAECVPSDGLNRGFETFGNALALEGDLLVAASGSHSAGGAARGAAYVFRHGSGGWQEEARLSGADLADHTMLGTTAAVSSTRLLLGAPGYRDANGNEGAVFEYLHRNGRWEPAARIAYSRAGAGETHVGDVLAMAGDTIVVGSPFAFEDWRGAAYVLRFHDGAWVATDLVDETPRPQQGFGFDVATDGRRAIVSSWGQTAMRIGGAMPNLAPAEPDPVPVIRRGATIYDIERGWK